MDRDPQKKARISVLFISLNLTLLCSDTFIYICDKHVIVFMPNMKKSTLMALFWHLAYVHGWPVQFHGMHLSSVGSYTKGGL